MRDIVSAFVVLMCFFMSVIALDSQAVEKCRFLRARGNVSEEQIRRIGRKQILLISIGLSICSAFTMWRLTDAVSDPINLIKLSIALICMTGSGCVDFIEYRIPNIFPLILSVSAVLLLGAGFATGQQGAFAYVVSSVFSTAVCTVGLVIAAVLTKSGIGAGDIKLVAALALIGGVHVVAGTLFFGMILCAVAACVLLATKKKTMEQAIPFGPFLLIGYMITICTLEF